MNVYEREYFVSRIRSGFYHIKDGNLKIRVLPPTPEDEFLANEFFMEVMEQLEDSDVMTELEMKYWMSDQGLWSEKDDLEITKCKDKIEEIKLKMYQERHNSQYVSEGKKAIAIVEKGLTKLNNRKDEYFNNTVEGVAFQDKALFLFERCCYLGNERFDFAGADSTAYYYNWVRQILKEKDIRSLVRQDPWRHYWMLREEADPFHKHPGRDLSPDQKNAVVWSKMYDNVYENPEAPTEDVIEDDDLLDGWFIYQKKKAESEKIENDVESKLSSNPKIANAQEVLVMANNKKDVDNINKLNTPVARRNKAERINTVKRQGKATDLDFRDKKMEIRNQANEMFKNNFRR